MSNNNLYVQIKYQNNNEIFNSPFQSFHINNKPERITSKKYMIGGGFYNKRGGNFVFNAKYANEVKEIAQNSTLMKENTSLSTIYFSTQSSDL
jgi:mannose-1-phosphate guanylyltransferase